MRRELERAADELFEVTAQGLDHFAAFFGRPYPFDKYDQLFVPEFNAGAMENVAAVTFHDSFLFRDPPTWSQRLERAEVVLHELAHMWFGDLVTMRWWDDLWLNETFATYAAYLCLAEATRFEDAWRVFNGQMRPAAVRQDQLSHDAPDRGGRRRHGRRPGELRRDHVREGRRGHQAARGDARRGCLPRGRAHVRRAPRLGQRDARRLPRGALGRGRRAARRLGGGVARDAVAQHDRRARGASGTVASTRWSSTSARPTPIRRCDPTPRRSALVAARRRRRRPRDDRAAGSDRRGPSATVPGAVGLRAPLFVFPNHGDHDYALAALDDASVAFALERLPDLDDPMLRQQTWSALWDMVRDGRLRVGDFLGAVERFAPGEQMTRC